MKRVLATVLIALSIVLWFERVTARAGTAELSVPSVQLVPENEDALEFYVRKSVTQTRTLGLRVAWSKTVAKDQRPSTTIRAALTSDLIDYEHDKSLLRELMTIDTEELKDRSGDHLVTVTFKGSESTGRFESSLRMELRLDEDDTVTHSRTIPITVEVTEDPVEPKIKLGPNSLSPLITVMLPWYDVPGIGSPIATKEALASTSVFLLTETAADAVVESASVLHLKAGDSLLTEDAVFVTTPLSQPLKVEHGGAPRRLGFAVGGVNLPAGEYSGQAQLNLAEPKGATLSVPLKVRIKHGWLLPFLTLALGITAGALLSWWKKEGKRRRDFLKQLDLLSAGAAQGRPPLPVENARQIADSLKELYRRFTANEALTSLEPVLTETRTKIEEVRASVRRWLDRIAALESGVDALPYVNRMKSALAGTLEKQRVRLEAGKLPSLAAAESDLAEVGDITRRIRDLKELLSRVPAPSQQQKNDLEKASTISEVAVALGEAPPVGVPYSQTPKLPREETWSFTLRSQRRFLLGAGQIVPLILYSFALYVGFVTLYISDPTFGASHTAYINIFLWGTVAESIRGNAMNLTELSSLYTEKKRP